MMLVVGIEIYPCIKFGLSHLSVVYMHIHMPLRMYWPRLLFQEIQCLHNFNHDDVRHVTDPFFYENYLLTTSTH